jgi:phospholipase/carboxylesterase
MTTLRGEHAFTASLAWRMDGAATDPTAPLVLALHGHTQDEDRFARTLRPLLELPLRFLIPRAPFPVDVRREKRIGASWYAYDGDATRFAVELQRTEALLLGLLRDVETQQALRPRARILLGYSQGGYCGAPFALRHPELFSGLIVSGARVKTEILTDALPAAASHGMRVLLVHGRNDDSVPFEFATRGHDALRDAGVDVTLQAIDGGHLLEAAQITAIEVWLQGFLGA